MIYRQSSRGETKVASRRGLGVSTLAAALLSVGGCSFSEKLPGLFDSETTGAIANRKAEAAFDPSDWAIAQGALLAALNAPADAAPTAWSNPQTSRRGEFMAVAAWFADGDRNCRSFVARIVGGGEKRVLQAKGCLADSGRVEVGGLAFWKGL